MAPAFGFSVGDLIAVIKLVHKVSKVLQDSDGTSGDVASLLQELRHLQIVLEQLRGLPPESSPNLSHLNALRGMALTVQVPLQDFLGKMEKYKAAAYNDLKSSRWKRAGRKIQWAILMPEEITRLRAAMTMKIAQTLFSIQQATIENGKAIGTSRKDVQEANEKLSKDIVETGLQVKNTGSNVSLNTERLLKICVGLRVGIKRLERTHGITRSHKPQMQDEKILRTVSTANARLQTSVDSLKLSIPLLSAAVRQLLQSSVALI
ncbi:MAG: hypothetical protein Q9160_005341 [Pyrenula sp. 1 TL-2023]